MTLYYIEMGQGVVVPTPDCQDLLIGTSPLLSCVLIAGCNSNTRHAGAFHYPATELKNPEVAQDMSDWLEELKPTQIRLVTAASQAFSMMGSGTDPDDLNRLKEWLSTKGYPASDEKSATNGAMHVLQGVNFDIGTPNYLGAEFNKEASDVDLSEQAAGNHGGYVLFGKDLN